MQATPGDSPARPSPSLRTKLIFFGVNLGVVTLAYFPLTTPHFGTDSYAAFYDLSPGTSANLGRLLTTLLAFLFERAGFFPIHYQVLFTWAMILITALCATIVALRLRGELVAGRDLETVNTHSPMTDFALLAGVLIGFVNVALLEWFLFPEVILYFALALLLSILAFAVWSGRKGVWGVAATCALLFAALNLYQATLGFFVILALTVVIVRHRSLPARAAWMDGLEVAAIGALCAITNLALTQVGQRIGWLDRDVRNPGLTFENLSQSAAPVLKSIAWAWDGFFGLVPAYSIAATAFALVAVLLSGAILGHFAWNRLILPAAALVTGVGVVFAPHLITAAVWITPRSIASIFGLYVLLVAVDLLLSRQWRLQLVVGVIAAAFVALSIWQVHAIIASHLLHNNLEQREARTIVDEIEEHERQSGVEIWRVGIVLDEEPTWTYPEVSYAFHDLNARAITRSWSDLALLHHVSGRHFARAEISQEKRAQLLERHPNWLEFDADDQVSFEGDVAYIVVY